MGNYRFRLADMMPNVWFYKLKDMGKARNHITNTTHSLKKKQQASAAATSATISQSSTSKIKQQPHHSSYHHPRKSYYITRELITSDDHEQHQQHQTFQNSPTNAKSFPDPPRRSSSRQIHKRRTTATTTKSSSTPSSSSPKLLVTSSVSSGCSCKATLWTKPECPPDCSASPSDTSPEDDLELRDSFAPELFRSDSVLSTKQSSSFDSKAVSSSNSCGCKLGSNQNDIVIDVDNGSLATEKVDYFHSFDNISDIDLPPIITKAAKFDEKFEDMKKQETTTTSTSTTTTTTNNRSRSMKHRETEIQNPLPVKIAKENVKRHSVNYQGHVRLRIHSPRIGSRRFQAHGRRSVSCSYSSSSSSRKSLSDSLAIVKASFDPRRDFRESMVEMIRENNIRASKDLEDLLACYLSLNSDEYHDLIINVFRQIWFDLTNTRLK